MRYHTNKEKLEKTSTDSLEKKYLKEPGDN
jgi:hypothetical protein